MNRTNLLNWLVFSHGYNDYLEIGVQQRKNFNFIKARNKIGVDPIGNCKFPFTSDEFFSMINPDYKFDLIFIDGLHTEEQVDKDIQNSLKYLREKGTIVIHDCNPLTEEAQAVPRIQTHWNGTVWKSFVKRRLKAARLTMRCVNIDEGCGIIQRGKPDKMFDWAPCELNWKVLDEHREELLGLITWDEFCQKYDPPWFIKIEDGKIYKLYRTEQIGFPKDSEYTIPQEYLDAGIFMIFRYAFGLGDWAIVSAMPRLLKEKYPDCKVYLPSKEFVNKKFIPDGELSKWECWGDPRDVIEYVFKNNPYVDGYVDEMPGVVYHDHYRMIPDDENTPIIEQMLAFWGFTPEEYKDSQPELYFSDEEKEIGDALIENIVGKDEFGCLLITEKHDKDNNNKIQELLDKNPLPYFYYLNEHYNFRFEAVCCFSDAPGLYNYKEVPIRIQLYVRSKAKINVGNQCGVNDAVVRYSNVYSVPRHLKHNFVRGQNYI